MRDVSTDIFFLFSGGDGGNPIEGVFANLGDLQEAAASVSHKVNTPTWEVVTIDQGHERARVVYAWVAGWPGSPAVASAHWTLQSARSWIHDDPRRSSGYDADVLDLVRYDLGSVSRGSKVEVD